jgi:protein-tyrosine kinase
MSDMDRTMERAENFLPRVDEAATSRNEVDGRMVTLTAPASVAAEQYRTLFYRLERLRELRPLKVVALTSAMPGEGKTVTAVNLALTAARANPDRRIVLVDADLRRGQVADVLGIRSRPGLSELIAGDAEIKDVVRRFQSTRLTVIPSGSVPEEPTGVLSSQRMKQLMKSLRDNFDEVYIVLPPAIAFADAAILGGAGGRRGDGHPRQRDPVAVRHRGPGAHGRRAGHRLRPQRGGHVLGAVPQGPQPLEHPQ